MNLQNRLDQLERAIKPTPRPNPFGDMTEQQLRQLTNELGELVKTEADQDPNTLDKLDPALLSLLKDKGLLD